MSTIVLDSYKQKLTHSMEMNPSWEAASHPATKDFHNILRNLDVHHGVRKCPPLIPIMSHITLVHTTLTNLSKELFLYYPPTHISNFLAVPFLLSFLATPCKHLSSLPYILHILLISSSSTSLFQVYRVFQKELYNPESLYELIQRTCAQVWTVIKKQILWPESVDELCRPSNCRLSMKLVPTFAGRGCLVVSVTDTYGLWIVIL
jgi:hypothetical protein